MQSVVGIFSSQRCAEDAYRGLLAIGIPTDAVTFLCCGEGAEPELETVPTTDAEAPGMGKTLGAYVGGVLGATGGLTLGTVLTATVVPGLGPILAAGYGAAALLGLGGAVVGAAVGSASEHELDLGVPRDDVEFYRELLRHGRSLVIAEVDSDEMRTAAEAVLRRHGSHDVNSVRSWWERNRSKAA